MGRWDFNKNSEQYFVCKYDIISNIYNNYQEILIKSFSECYLQYVPQLLWISLRKYCTMENIVFYIPLLCTVSMDFNWLKSVKYLVSSSNED